MASIRILRRREAVRFPTVQTPEEVIAVTYSTPALPPRIVYLPREGYRPPTPEERAQNPDYQVVPATPVQVEEERRSIERDYRESLPARTDTFEV